MESVKSNYIEKYPEVEDAFEKIPTITHNQRNKSTIMIEVPDHEEIEVNDLIEIIESSLSSPTHEILKREDEAEVVIQAHENPKFVEDVVRDILSAVLYKYNHLPDDVLVVGIKIN